MEAFSKRYFVLICLIFLAFARFSYNYSGLKIFIIFSIAIGIIYLILRKFRPKTKNLTVICLLLVLSSMIGTLNTSLDMYKNEMLEEKYGGRHEISGYVAEVLSDEVYMGEYVARVEEVDGEKASFTAVIVAEYETELQRGDFFTVTCDVMNVGDYENSAYLGSARSGEYALAAVVKSNDVLTYLDTEFRAELLFSDLNHKLSARLKQVIGGKSGALASALLLGNRELLSDNVLRDFRRAGVYHMLALSGLHVSILIGLLEFLLRKIRLPKLGRIITLAAVSLFYIALTGFLPSACRSMLMLWAVYLSYIAERQSDSMTSLFAAVCIIVFFTPSAVRDLGLLLSFLSTFGVIAALMIVESIKFPEFAREEYLKKGIFKAIKGLIGTVLIGLCTFTATLPFLMIYFGEVSLATFASNLFMGVICEVFMVLSLITVAMPWGTQISAFCGEITHNFGAFMMDTVKTISDTDDVMLSLSYPNIEYLVWGFFIASIVLFGIKLPKKRLLAVPCVLFAVLLCICVISYRDSREDFARAEYASGDVVVISSSDEVYICDMSNGRYGGVYNGVGIAKENCFTEIDGVILTHYHSYHVVSLERLAKSFKLHRVLLPVPQNDSEELVMRAIVRVMVDQSIPVYLFDSTDTLDIAGGKLSISERAYKSGVAHPSVAMSFAWGGERVTVLQRPYFGSYLETSGRFEEYIKDTDYLIYGSDGRTPKEDFEIFSLLKEGCEVSFCDRKTLLLSDYEDYLDKMQIYFDVLYKKYDLK